MRGREWEEIDPRELIEFLKDIDHALSMWYNLNPDTDEWTHSQLYVEAVLSSWSDEVILRTSKSGFPTRVVDGKLVIESSVKWLSELLTMLEGRVELEIWESGFDHEIYEVTDHKMATIPLKIGPEGVEMGPWDLEGCKIDRSTMTRGLDEERGEVWAYECILRELKRRSVRAGDEEFRGAKVLAKVPFIVNIAEMLAYDDGAPPVYLEKLSRDPRNRVREAVAENPKAPVELLRELAGDASSSVRAAVARNPSTPSDVLRELAEDGYEWVRRALAGNPNTPRDVLVELSRDPHWEVRLAVAGNPNTPPEVLVKLAGDSKEEVREAAIANPNATPRVHARAMVE